MKTSACRDGTLKNQPNKMGTTPQHIHTIPTSCAILPTMLCVCDLFLLVFFFLVFLEIIREKRGGKGRRGEDAWSVKYESIELCCSQGTKNHHKFKVKL